MPRTWLAAIATFAAVGCIATLAFVIPLDSIPAPDVWHVSPHRTWTVLVLTLAGAAVGAPTWMALRSVASGPAGALAAAATVGGGLAVAPLGWRSWNLEGLVIDAACLAGIALPLGAAATLWLPIPSDPPPTAAPAGPFAPPVQDRAPPAPPREGLASAALWFACVDAGIAAMVLGTQFVPAAAAVADHATRSLTVAVTLACFALGGACAHAPAWLVLRRAGLWRWPAAILSPTPGSRRRRRACWRRRSC